MEGICAFCGGPATLKCTACESVYYCGKQHQKQHWKQHHTICKPYKVEESPVLGRHCVAVRSLKPGEVIMREDSPIVAGPMHNSVPVCLSCYQPLDQETATPCTKCGWPLCPVCPRHGPECAFTSSRREHKVSIRQFGLPHPSYQCINVIRALSLKTEKPEDYRRLLSLEDHGDKMREIGEVVFDSAFRVVDFMRRFFKVDDFPIDEIRKIVGILQINGHEVPTTDPAHVAVYKDISLLEHSCKANCSKSFTSNGGLLVHVAIPIAKREHISICYTDPLWGAVNRRHHLLRTKFFDCRCERCSDPTEFGSMFNSIKCPDQACRGVVTPESFFNDTARYICARCNTLLPERQAERILDSVGITLSTIKKNDIAACKEFLSCYSDILHENHFYMVDVNVALAQLIGQEHGMYDISEQLLKEKMQICRKLNGLLQILAPAEIRVRGLILFELHAALAEYGRRRDQKEAISFLIDSKKCLEEVNRLLEWEPEVLPEGKVALQAKNNLKKIDAMLKRFASIVSDF